MKKYIALLRGINVSGQKKIKMAELKLLFVDMSFQNVVTYIQSGNVIFSSNEKNRQNLENKISSEIKRKFGFEVKTFVLNPKKVQSVIENNPFINKKKELERLYVTFLSDKPTGENVQKLNLIDYSPEEYKIDKNCIYLFYPNGAGKAKLNNNILENKLKVFATTRNWRTINMLSELAGS